MKFITKYLIPGLVSVCLLIVVADQIWTASGDNKWTLVEERDGVKVFTKKIPGDPLLKIKSNMIVETRMQTAVYALRGDETTSEDFGAIDYVAHKQIENDDMYLGIYSLKNEMPDPFGTVEFVMMLNYAQDPETGAVQLNVQGAPGLIPPTPGVRRVQHLNNLFNVTPLGDGKVKWEMIMDVDIGLPYPLFNVAMPAAFVEEMSKMRETIKQDKFRNVELASVVEPQA